MQQISKVFNSKIIQTLSFSGNFQVDLLNRLIGSCLDPHYRLLVLQYGSIFELLWKYKQMLIVNENY